MKTIKISFLGLGTVGSKLMEYIQSHVTEISKVYGYHICIDKVFVRDIYKRRSIDTSNLYLTSDPYEAIEDADVIIECLGGNGVELTRELIINAIQNNKSIIMSSKKCLALYGKEIIAAVNEYHTIFHYDATVGGGIPISTIIDTMGKCESIESIYGICNATSNYILNQMTQNNISYSDALKMAVSNGYAENNPQEDVDGYDALYKAIIMVGLSMNQWLDIEKIIPISISSISNSDILIAKRRNCVIKPVFIIQYHNEHLSLYIGPKLIAKNTLMATVNHNNNIIIVRTNESLERAFFGQGAGAKPTASAMYDDLMKTLIESSTRKCEEYVL